MLNRLLNPLSSLRLTVVCLCLALVLVFVGTIAQVEQGLYQAQERFFRSLLIYWGPAGASWKLPIFPGGYLIGGVLLVNLLAAHAKRFKLAKRKIGILIIHAGIILLLVGQFATDLFQVESLMRLTENQPMSYSEDGSNSELAVIDSSRPDFDEVVSFPDTRLAAAKEIKHEKLPFTIQVKHYLPNSRLARRAPMVDKEPPPATQGFGPQLKLSAAPLTGKMDERNVRSAVLEIFNQRESLGTWLVSDLLDDPQAVAVGGKTYQLALRRARYYKPYSLELQKFTHEVYQGTSIPKNFASRVRLQRPDTREDREALIYMNNPLRYGGETYYQSGFDDKDPRISILQVVRNPGWLTPYAACVLVSLGLVVQFLQHLIGFAMKRRTV
jgi:hypothetical protein